MRISSLFGCHGHGVDPEKQSAKDTTKDTIKDTTKDSEVQETGSLEERGRLWLQCLAALSASFALIGCGAHLGWTSPALPYLTGPDSKIPVTAYEGSWIVSIYILGAIVGSLVNPLIVDRLGRKRTLLAFALPQLVAWAMIVPARSAELLYGARYIAGFSQGGIFNVAIIYLAEIADKRVRGAFGTVLKSSMNVGCLFSATAGAYLTYDQLNLVSFVPSVIFLVSFTFAPESPYFYLINDREDEAVKTMLQLRRLRKPESVRQDLEVMRQAVEEGKRTRGGLWELVAKRSNRRGLWILLCLKATQQLSGQLAITAYTQEIMGHSGSKLAPEYAAIVLGCAQIFAGFLSASLIDRLGRRFLLLSSGCGASLALAVVGTFFYFRENRGANVAGLTWIPIVSLVTYETVSCLGINTVPYVIIGEIFPTNVKGQAVAASIIIGSLFGFVVSLGFQALNTMAGIHSTFWFFAVCCSTGSLLAYFITPETKGMSLEEIQELFQVAKTKTARDP